MVNLHEVSQDLTTLLNEFAQQTSLKKGQLFIVGCSTSEVKGEKIGTAGGLEIAEAIYQALTLFSTEHQVELVFQGCEHINRALTMERATAERLMLEEVAVIPVVTAGGSMSTFAYRQLKDPVVVEEVQGHAGIDIGQTLIGMHLRKVAVPVRTSIRKIGEAIVTVASTRPKRIGGERAVYTIDK